MGSEEPRVEHVTVRGHAVPTDRPEAGATRSWEQATVVVARVAGGGRRGLLYSYGEGAGAADPAASGLGLELRERDAERRLVRGAG